MTIRARCLKDDTDIPPAFWMMVSLAEFQVIAENGGYLNKALTKLLWRMLGRTNPPITYGPILVLKADVEARWPEKPNPQDQKLN